MYVVAVRVETWGSGLWVENGMTAANLTRPGEELERVMAAYGADEPMGAYSALLSFYGVCFGAFIAAAASGKVKIRSELSALDILILGIGTHKIARIIAMDEVTAPIRAPFSRRRGEGDKPSEVDDTPRGSGMQKAFGTLVTCPWCLSPWVAAGSVAGAILFPKATRTIAAIFCIAGISDFTNSLYEVLWSYKRPEQ